jgi:hypothetical protein
MIEPITEHYYDILLSVFLGIICALVINQLFANPRTPIIFNKK